jgi:hypothetical protein
MWKRYIICFTVNSDNMIITVRFQVYHASHSWEFCTVPALVLLFLFATCISLNGFWFQTVSWSWCNGSWIYSYLCNHSLSSLTLWVRSILDTTLYVIKFVSDLRQVGGFLRVLQFPIHEITEILLKVALNTITLTLDSRLPYYTNSL